MRKLLKSWRIVAGVPMPEFFGGLLARGPFNNILNTITYSAAPTPDASLGNFFVVTITDAVAFVVGAPTNPPSTGFSQCIAITFKNASGGAHGAGTWNAVYKTQATVFPAIATGFSRTVWFRWDGTNWVEVSRSAADVAN